MSPTQTPESAARTTQKGRIMARSTWITRRIGIGLLAVTIALGGLLSEPAGTFARVGGKMHLDDISMGIVTDKGLPALTPAPTPTPAPVKR